MRAREVVIHIRGPLVAQVLACSLRSQTEVSATNEPLRAARSGRAATIRESLNGPAGRQIG
jgi:hypothetical protein